MSAEAIAREFYMTCRLLAPNFNFTARETSFEAWEELPWETKSLLVAVVNNLLNRGVIFMTEPKLEIEKRLDRIELAVGTMAQWLVQAQTGFGAHDAEGIEKILRGETPPNKATVGSQDNPETTDDTPHVHGT